MKVSVSLCDMLSLPLMNNVQASTRLTRAGAAWGAGMEIEGKNPEDSVFVLSLDGLWTFGLISGQIDLMLWPNLA